MTGPQVFAAPIFQVSSSNEGTVITFIAPPIIQGAPQATFTVFLPLVTVKQLALVLRKHMLLAEERIGTIRITPEQWEKLGVAPEDWPNR